MISHKKVINKFYQIEKKYFNDNKFDISKNHLHYLILNNNYKFIKLTITGIITNSILLFLSLITILICKFRKISLANYFIVHRGLKGVYDFRSNYILNNYDFEKSLNIIRCTSFFDSLKAYLLYPNVIFYLPFDYFNNSFPPKTKSILSNYKVLHIKEKKNYEVIKKIFIFLNIKKFISIDDQRTIQVFLKVCRDLKIKSFGYMHYKFTKYVVGFKYLPFDNFIVWSDYFKKKLLEVNKDYKSKNIFISGFPIKKLSKKNNKNINLLYLFDLNLNFIKTCGLLKKLNKEKKINLFLKLKPQKIESKWDTFCQEHKIKYFKFETLDQINKIINFDYFIATISTAILESSLYKAIPLKLYSGNDFADDLIKDKVVINVKNFEDINKIARYKVDKKKLNRIFLKVWGIKKYKSIYIKRILSKYFYDKRR